MGLMRKLYALSVRLLVREPFALRLVLFALASLVALVRLLLFAVSRGRLTTAYGAEVALLRVWRKGLGAELPRGTVARWLVLVVLAFDEALWLVIHLFGPILWIFLCTELTTHWREPEQRYNTTGTGIFFGFSEHYKSFATQLGTDLIHETHGYIGFTMLLIFAVVVLVPLEFVTSIYAVRHWKIKGHGNPEDRLMFREKKDVFLQYHAAKFWLIWGEKDEQETYRAQGVGREHRTPWQFQPYRMSVYGSVVIAGAKQLNHECYKALLAEAAMSDHLAFVTPRDVGDPIDWDLNNVLEKGDEAVGAAVERPQPAPKQRWNQLLAKYELWSLGLLSHHPVHHVLFWVWYLISSVFVRYHFWRLIFMKLLMIGAFAAAATRAHEAHHVWAFHPAPAEWSSLVCGNQLQRVDYANTLSAHGCLTAATKSEISAGDLQHLLTHLKPHASTVTAVDLSQQCWLQWTDQEFTGTLSLLESTYGHISTFNFSAAVPSCPRVAMPAVKFRALLSLLSRCRNLSVVDFSGQMFGNDNVAQLFAVLAPGVVHLNLSNTALTDTGVQAVAAYALAKSTSFKTLQVGNNQLTQDGLKRLLQPLTGQQQQAIEQLDLSDNLGQAFTLDVLLAISNTSVQTLDISGSDLSAASKAQVDAFGLALQRSRVTALRMSNTQIAGSIVIFLAPWIAQSNVTELDWSSNNIATEILATASAFAGSSVQALNLGNNPVGSQGLDFVRLAFGADSNATLAHLDLSNVGWRDANFTAFCNDTLPQLSSLQSLVLAGNFLSATSSKALAAALAGRSLRMQHLDLSYCNMGSSMLVDIFVAVASNASNISSIIVAGNSLTTAEAGAAVGQAISRGLVECDLTNTQLSAAASSPIFARLRGSVLEVLRLSKADLSDQQAFELATSLLPLIPEADKLLAPEISIDQQRHIFSLAPASRVRVLDVSVTQLSAAGARALCRAWNKAAMGDAGAVAGRARHLLDLRGNGLDDGLAAACFIPQSPARY